MASSGIAGLRGSGTGDYATDERPKSFREMILWRDPNGMTPLTALMSKMKTDAVDDPEFSWWEEELAPARVQLNSQIQTAATAVSVYTTGDFTAIDFVLGDMLMVESTTSAGTTHWEIMEVSANPTVSTSLTVSRGVAGTTAATALVASGTWVVKIGSAFAEGSDAAAPTFRVPTKYYNYTEIFKTTYSISKTASKTKFRTGDPLKNERKRKSFYHAQQLEHASLFGHRNETTGTASSGVGSLGRTGMPKRYTGGLAYFLRANYNASATPTMFLTAAGSLTEENFLDATYKMFDYGYTGAGNERIALCGNGFLNTVNKMVLADSATRINYEGTIKEFGMKLGVWNLPQGTIYFRSHPMMNVNAKFTNSAFFINPSGITYRPLRGRDTDYEDNIQLPGADYFAGQWKTEAGFEFHHLRSMLYMELL